MVSFELVESASRPPERAAALLDAWRRFHAEGAASGMVRPTRADFTPFALKPWLGNVDIYEVEGTGPGEILDFRMRLNGSEVVTITGENWTGKTVRDIDRRFGCSLFEEFRGVYRSRQPLAHFIRIFQKDHVPAFRVLLPVFAESGDGAVAQIFLAIFPLH